MDVCRELGLAGLDDLAHVTPKDLDDLPNYLKDKLKPIQKKRLLALIGQQTIAGGQHS